MAPAESLVSSGSARNALGEPETVVTPGYPLYLATFLFAGLGYSGAVAGQRLLWILVVAATTRLTFRLSGSIIAAIVAGLITTIDVPALQATNSILSDAIATVFVGAGAWQAYRAASRDALVTAVITGIIAGFAALVRPIAILIGVPLAVAIVVAGSRRGRATAAAAVLAVSLIAPSLWAVRNYVETGVATFSSLSGINLLLYRAAGSLAIRDPGGVDANFERRRAELSDAACREVEQRLGRACASVPIAQRAALYSGLAWPIIIGHPVGTALQAGRAFVMIMFGGGANLVSTLTGIPESTARIIAFAYSVPLAALALIGIAYWRRINALAAWTIVLTIGYLLVMSLGVEAYSRFRVPFLPLYAMLAGGGAAQLINRHR